MILKYSSINVKLNYDLDALPNPGKDRCRRLGCPLPKAAILKRQSVPSEGEIVNLWLGPSGEEDVLRPIL